MGENTDPGKSLGEGAPAPWGQGTMCEAPRCRARGTCLASGPASQDRLSIHAAAAPEVTQKQASCCRMAHHPQAQKPRPRRSTKVSDHSWGEWTDHCRRGQGLKPLASSPCLEPASALYAFKNAIVTGT